MTQTLKNTKIIACPLNLYYHYFLFNLARFLTQQPGPDQTSQKTGCGVRVKMKAKCTFDRDKS